MKIVQINSCNFGSTGNIMLDIASYARDNGHTVYTSCPDSRTMRRRPLNNHIYIGSIIERNLHLKMAYFSGKSSCYSKIGTKLFLKKLDKINPDIIHLHNLHDSYINVKMLFDYIKKRNIKVVWTLHDCWAFTGHCPYFDMADCNKWKNVCFDCPQYHKYPVSKFDNSKMMYDLKKEWFTGVKDLTIVTPSNWLAELVKQSFLKAYPVKTIYNGIDLKVFKPTESDFRVRYNLEEKFVVLGVAGPWSERKGLKDFIELSKLTDNNFKIVLVGTNDSIDKLLPENIISIHRTNNQKELAEIYSMADVFVNPTKEEVLGMVNLEALACGTPVVTYNTGGAPECIDEKTGIIVDKGDLKALIKAINYYKNMEDDKSLYTQKAEMFDKNIKYKEYVELYEKLVNK